MAANYDKLAATQQSGWKSLLATNGAAGEDKAKT
jgi:hypothetical protein